MCVLSSVYADEFLNRAWLAYRRMIKEDFFLTYRVTLKEGDFFSLYFYSFKIV